MVSYPSPTAISSAGGKDSIPWPDPD